MSSIKDEVSASSFFCALYTTILQIGIPGHYEDKPSSAGRNLWEDYNIHSLYLSYLCGVLSLKHTKR